MTDPVPDDPSPAPGHFAQMIEAAREAARRDARNHGGLIGAAYNVLGHDRALALTLAKEALPLVGDNFDALRGLSGIFDACGDRETAIATGREATRLRPDHSEASLHLGGLLLAESRAREAVAALAAHVSLPGATESGWYLLSVALHRSGELRRALDAAARAVGPETSDSSYILHYAGLLGSLGRYGDAADTLAASLPRHGGEPAIWRALSGMREVLCDLPGALDAAERASALAPEDAALSLHRNQIASQLNLGRSGPPEELLNRWKPREKQRAARAVPPVNFLGALARRGQVIHALLLWEMRGRYARSRLGYVWGVVEPLGHILTIGLMFSVLNNGHPPIGSDIFVFYVTGVCPYLMFARTSEEVAGSVQNGKAALQLPVVQALDVVLARALLMLATELVSISVLFALFAALERQAWPEDPMRALSALTCLWVFGIGVGLMNMVIREFASSWEFVWQAFVRLLYFASGIYFSAIVMPNEIRDILMWNPILQGIEWFRSGFYAEYNPPWLDRSYLLQATVTVLLLGLAMERAGRARLMRQAVT
jgi:capsular polysaccharide transport system permease protein